MKKIWKMRYQILEKLGQGGRGCVYKVRDIHLEKDWALKLLDKKDDAYGSDSGEEWVTLKRISHPNFPRIVDAFEEDGKLAIVMDLIVGVTLEEVIKRGPIEEKQMIFVAKQICEAIHYLHVQTPTLLYLDLKPANIMIEESGMVKLIDLGSVAIKGKTGPVSGTFGYASPEQIRVNKGSDGLTEQSDIFSFGMILYACATGNCVRLPVIDSNIRRGAIIREKNSHISRKVERIIEKCTRGIPTRRYYSMREVQRELEIWEKKYQRNKFEWYVRTSKKDRQWYQEKSIFCTEGKHSFFIAKRLLVLFLIFFTILIPSKKLNVILRDCGMRKVLVRNGCAYETKSNLIFEIPWEEIEGKNCTIMVECKDQSPGRKRFYIDCILVN